MALVIANNFFFTEQLNFSLFNNFCPKDEKKWNCIIVIF